MRKKAAATTTMVSRPRHSPLLSPLLPLLLAASFLLLAPHPSRAEEYNPRNVDWSSVVDACAAAMRFERRLASFALRSSFHDAGSLTPQCAATPSPTCGGADGSLMVSAEEQLHLNNRDELFASNTARFVLPIAMTYGASVADTLYVCALVAPAILSSPAVLPSGPNARSVRTDPIVRAALAAGFKVGRIDRTTSGPDGNDPSLLPMATLTLTAFSEWFESRLISLEDAGALLGVHTLLRPKGCYVDGRFDRTTGLPKGCVPFAEGPGRPLKMPGDSGPFTVAKGACPMVSMLKWDNSWFNNLCGIRGEGGFDITNVPMPEAPLKFGQPGFAQQVANSVCGYRSDAFRADAVNRQLEGGNGGNGGTGAFPDNFVTAPSAPTPTVIDWQCPSTGCRSNPRTFFFTQNDAHLGDACRAGALLSPAKAGGLTGAAAAAAADDAASSSSSSSSSSAAAAAVAEVAAAPAAAALMQSATLNPSAADDVALVKALRASFLEYTGGAAGLKQWGLDFAIAYASMSSMGAQWSTDAYVPTLMECQSGWVHAQLDNRRGRTLCAQRCGRGSGGDCPDACRCATAPKARVVGVVPAAGAVTSAP